MCDSNSTTSCDASTPVSKHNKDNSWSSKTYSGESLTSHQQFWEELLSLFWPPWKTPHSHSQTESRDRVELLAGLGEAEQVGDQQAQGAEDQEGALELAFFNRDMETACGRDQESWQVNDVIFHHHHHHNPPCHQSASSLTLSASSLLLSASLLKSFLCSWSSLSIHRDHAAMAEIYSGNIMVSAINFF